MREFESNTVAEKLGLLESEATFQPKTLPSVVPTSSKPGCTFDHDKARPSTKLADKHRVDLAPKSVTKTPDKPRDATTDAFCGILLAVWQVPVCGILATTCMATWPCDSDGSETFITLSESSFEDE